MTRPAAAAAQDLAERTQHRVRRFAALRAAQRALEDVVEPEDLYPALEMGRVVLRRLRGLTGEEGQAEIVNPAEALAGVDALLEKLSACLREALLSAPLPALCASLAPLAREESGALRALAAVVLGGDLDAERTLDIVELLTVLLCCVGPAGRREIGRSPLEALPELGRLERAEVHEAHPEIDEAQQIFGRGVMRLARDDLGATRDRIRAFKRRLGVRLLHPEVLAAAVAYDVSMGNVLAEKSGDHDSLDAIAETVFGADAVDPEAVAAIRARKRLPVLSAKPELERSRLFWQSIGTAALSIGLLVLAVLLWQRPSVDVLPRASASDISSHLVSGYVSGDDGTPRFVGTVGPSWGGLPLPERRRVVTRIAARLDADGVRSVTLMDAGRAIQARHEDDSLLWVTPPGGP